VHGASKIDRVILWAGLLPPEVDPAGAAHERLACADLHLVLGKSDDMLEAEQIRAQRELLEKAGVRHSVLEFDGGHVMDRATLERLG
jgi:predicted esterase